MSLGRLDEIIKGSNVAFFYLGGAVDPGLMPSLKSHPSLLNLTWFGFDEVPFNHTPTISVYPELAEIKLIHPYIDNSPDTSNQVFNKLNALYLEEFGKNMSRYTGNIYDAVWLSALTLIEIEDYDNKTFIETFPRISKEYIGVSGNCTFDQYGNRLHGDYSIRQFVKRGWDIYIKEIGYFDWEKGEIEWKP